MLWPALDIFLRGKNDVFAQLPLADPGSGQGGPHNFFRDFTNVAKRSQASEASKYWPGSRAHLRALEALAFLTLKYVFSHFLVLFLQNILCTFMRVNYKISV